MYLILAVTISILMFGVVSISAYTGNYSFEIIASVIGTNVHTLANASTSTDVSADTYYGSYVVCPTKDNYSVELEKSWLTKYKTSQITADGNSYIKGFGILPSGDYTVNVYKNTANDTYAIGEGTINQ